MAENGGVNPPQQTTWFDDWAARTPIITRFVIMTLLIGSIVGWVTGLSAWTNVSPILVVMKLQLWRPFTAWLVEGSIFSLLFGLISMAMLGPVFERSEGSVKMLWTFGILTLAKNVLLVVLAYLLAVIGIQMFLFDQFGGMWATVLAMVTIDCMRNPEQTRRMFCLPVDIPNKYFPLVILAVLTLLSFGGIPIDQYLGVAAGYAYSKGHLDSVLKLSRESQERLEQGSMAFLAAQQGFIFASAATGGDPVMGGPGSENPTHPSQAGQQRGGAAGNIAGFGGGQLGAAASVASGGGVGGAGSFGGSGHTLGGASGGSGGGGMLPSLLPAGLGGLDSGAGGPSKDERRAAARAAAEARLGGGGSVVSTAGGGNGSGPHESEVRSLVAMGFEERPSRQALATTGGDIAAAAQLLATATEDYA